MHPIDDSNPQLCIYHEYSLQSCNGKLLNGHDDGYAVGLCINSHDSADKTNKQASLQAGSVEHQIVVTLKKNTNIAAVLLSLCSRDSQTDFRSTTLQQSETLGLCNTTGD